MSFTYGLCYHFLITTLPAVSHCSNSRHEFEFSPPSSYEPSKPIGPPVRFRNIASRGIADSASPACFFLRQAEQTSSESSLVRLRALCYLRRLPGASQVCSP
jgi:hypothetical protein